MKAGQTEPLQANHQFTPDAIALLLVFIVEESCFKEKEITILEMGSGMGILGATFLTSLDKRWITWEWKWMICWLIWRLAWQM